MAYTYAPDNPRSIDRIRLRLRDTTFLSPTPNAAPIGIFSDEEITMAIADAEGDLDAATALLARAFAADAARLSVSVQLGSSSSSMSLDRTQIAQAYLEIAERYEKKAKETPATATADWSDPNQTEIEILTGYAAFDRERSG